MDELKNQKRQIAKPKLLLSGRILSVELTSILGSHLLFSVPQVDSAGASAYAEQNLL
jgi:hypothetical protein